MKAKLLFLSMAVSLLLIGCKSQKVLVTPDGEQINLTGTSWFMHQKVIGLDAAPTITFNYVLHFVNNKEVVLEQLNDYSSYSGMMVNPNGTVDHHQGHSERDSKKGKYTVKGKVITVTLKDQETGETTVNEYRYHKSYLIYKLTEEEYEKLQDFEREYYTYKRMSSFTK